MSKKRFTRGSLLLVAALLLALVPLDTGTVGTSAAAAQVACGPGPTNLGFEDGILDASPECWTVVSASDLVKVTDTQGAADSSTYAQKGITVAPYRGDLMALLGRPKQINEKQPEGANRIEQTFTPQSDTLRLAFWFFSWEHRNLDEFLLDLKDSNGVSVGSTSFSIDMPDGATRGCSGALPCSFSFDVGKRNQFLDSGWVEVDITGIPVGEAVTLIYSLRGTDNNAHSTWVYADQRNSPPVANFTYVPGDPTDPSDTALTYEGSPVQLVDRSVDADDDIVSWEWTISWDGLAEPLTSNSQAPFFIPPDEGPVDVSLTVTDATGFSSTAISLGGVEGEAEDGAVVPVLNVDNAPPSVNAVDVEVLSRLQDEVIVDDARLIGRFSDAGWLDNQALTWSFEGSVVQVTDVEKRANDSAALATGLVTASATGLPISGEVSGTLSINDGEGGTSSDDFTVTVVPNDPGRFEPNNDPGGSLTSLTVDGAYLSYIQEAGDIDLFPIEWGQGAVANLPPGAEILITLKDLPADYDVVAFTSTGETAPFQLSPFQLSPFQLSPFQLSPFQLSPFQLSPFQLSPFQLSPFQLSPFQLSPFQLSPYQLSSEGTLQTSPFQLSPFQLSPLSQVGFTGLDAIEVGGTDIDVTELGLGSLVEAGFRVAGFSANRAQNEETVLVKIDEPGTELIVAVAGYGGAHSLAPFTIQVEGSMPFNSFALETGLINLEDVCVPLLPEVEIGGEVLRDTAAPETLIVTQRQLLEAEYGTSAVGELLASVSTFADHPDVQARVISVGGGAVSAAYTYWRGHPCDVEAANDVASAIRDVILVERAQNPTIANVIVLGNDDIVPSFRLPDDTDFANERYYLPTSFLKPGTPLFAAKQLGNNTSDDCFGDLALSPWQGRFTCIPDLALGRVIETPAQMKSAFDAFVASNGILDANSAFVSGHDFQTDLANDIIATASAANADVTSLIGDFWDADDVRCELLGQGCDTGADADVNSVLAHGLHFAILSANGYSNGVKTDFLTSTEVASARVGPDGSIKPLDGALFFTMACQVGLSVPNGSAFDVDLGLGIDPNLDFAEAFAEAGAGVLLGNSGFGIGDDQDLAGSEYLLSLFTKDLYQAGGAPAGDLTVGAALVRAKQRYVTELTAMTSIDEKVLVQLGLFGIPNYRVNLPNPSAPQAQAAAGVSAGSLTVTGIPGLNIPIALAKVGTNRGDYYTADGDADTTIGRPVVPRVVQRIPAGPGDPVVHGLLLVNDTSGPAATYTEETGFDPVIGRETIEWETESIAEPQVCFDGFWHSRLAHVNALETADGVEQRVVITPGQFRCTTKGVDDVRGVFRLYDSLNFELLESTSDDVIPPTALDVDVRPGEDQASTEIDLTLQDDATGIERVVALRIGPDGIGSGEIVSFEPDQAGPYAAGSDTTMVTVAIDDLAEEDRIVIQVADGAGNVTNVTAKTAQLRPIFTNIEADPTVIPGEVTFTITISGFDGLEPTVVYLLDFGDGNFVNGLIDPDDPNVTLDDDGNAVFSVTYTYADADVAETAVAKIEVSDGFGASGVDEVVLTRPCDPAGDAFDPDADLYLCETFNDATSLHIKITLAEGGVISPNYQYRIRVDANGQSKQLKYDDGNVTGPNSLVVVAGESDLEFVVDLADLGLSAGEPVAWHALTQAGVPGGPQQGFVDRAPDDEGLIEYVIE